MISKQKEKEIINIMISLYCKKNCKTKELCCNCNNLLNYANNRIDTCKKDKTFCSSCATPCYQKEKRIQIKKVMKFSGPRMIFYHPIIAIKHIKNTLNHKLNNKTTSERN